MALAKTRNERGRRNSLALVEKWCLCLPSREARNQLKMLWYSRLEAPGTHTICTCRDMGTLMFDVSSHPGVRDEPVMSLELKLQETCPLCLGKARRLEEAS